MDGNNMGNGQNDGQNQYSNHYQDNTTYIPNRVPMEGPRTNGLQIAGLVCGILAIVTCCCYGVPAVIFGIAGLTCSILGNRENKSGVGIAGLICSIIGIILGIIMICMCIGAMSTPGFWERYEMYYRMMMESYN